MENVFDINRRAHLQTNAAEAAAAAAPRQRVVKKNIIYEEWHFNLFQFVFITTSTDNSHRVAITIVGQKGTHDLFMCRE